MTYRNENLILAYILKIELKDGTIKHSVFDTKDWAEIFKYNYEKAGNKVHLFETLVIDPEWEW